MNQNTIGEFMQITRKEKGMTQKQLAEMINVSDKTISKWENGLSTPDTSILAPLCAALDISVNELITGKRIAPEEYSKNAEANIINLLRESQDSRKTSIIQYILGVILCIIAMALNFGTINGQLLWFIDLPSLILPTCICLAVVLLSGKKDLRSILRIIRKSVLPAGLVVSLSGFVSMMGSITDPERIGQDLGVCILTILYCTIAYIVVVVMEQHTK